MRGGVYEREAEPVTKVAAAAADTGMLSRRRPWYAANDDTAVPLW